MDRIFIFFKDWGICSDVYAGKRTPSPHRGLDASSGIIWSIKLWPFCAFWISALKFLPHFKDDRQCQGIAVDTAAGMTLWPLTEVSTLIRLRRLRLFLLSRAAALALQLFASVAPQSITDQSKAADRIKKGGCGEAGNYGHSH